MRNSMKLGLAMVVVALLALPLAANADSLTLTSGVSTVTVNGTGPLIFVGAVGAWNINVTTGLSGVSAAPDTLHLNSVDHTNGLSDPLTITYLADTGLPAPGPAAYSMSIGGTQTTGTSIAYDAYYNWGAAGQLKLGHLDFATSPFSGTAFSPAFTATAPYNLTQIVALDAGSLASTASFDATLDPVPEPASLVLLGSGLLGLAGLGRRKLRK